MKIISKHPRVNKIVIGLVLVFSVLAGVSVMPSSAASVAADSCTAPSTTYGTDTMTLSIPSSGTYYLWVRMQAPATTSNEILMNIDNNNCYNVGGSSSMPLNTWEWINYNDGSTNNVMSANLSAGNHSLVLTGIEGGVSVDRIEALGDGSCVPTGTGDNCTPAAPVDTTPPSVSITGSPAAVTQSSNATFSFSGTDNVTASSALAYTCSLDNAAFSSCNSPANYNGLAAGTHTFAVKATDAAGNVSTASTYSWKVDTTPPTVSISAPLSGTTLSGTATISASATDNVAVASVQFKLDGSNLGSADTTAPYTYSLNTTTLSNGNHSLTAVATDSAGNTATSSPVTVTVNNSGSGGSNTPPSVPGGLGLVSGVAPTATTIDLHWNASSSTGTGGLGGYKLYRNGSQIAVLSSLTTSYLDYGLQAGTSYSYTVAAYDNSGDTSAQSSAVSLTTDPLVGDLDGDGHVTGHDLSILLAHYNTNYLQGEFDGYSVVEGHDVSLLLSNYGK